VGVIHTERRVLSGLELEWPSRVHANQPQIFREVLPLDNSRRKVFVRCKNHIPLPPLPLSQKNEWNRFLPRPAQQTQSPRAHVTLLHLKEFPCVVFLIFT